jgi:hypothetical protein
MDYFLTHAVRWQDGALTDLGTLLGAQAYSFCKKDTRLFCRLARTSESEWYYLRTSALYGDLLPIVELETWLFSVLEAEWLLR